MNTDGSASGSPGASGAGGVFRNSRGFVKGAFAFNTGISFAYIAELKAAMFAIAKAKELGWNNLWIECDSTWVVHLLQSRSLDVPWIVRHQWDTCLADLNCLRVIVFHIYREGNIVADMLAKLGFQLSTIHWWSLFS